MMKCSYVRFCDDCMNSVNNIDDWLMQIKIVKMMKSTWKKKIIESINLNQLIENIIVTLICKFVTTFEYVIQTRAENVSIAINQMNEWTSFI